jgi:hypothetical protein
MKENKFKVHVLSRDWDHPYTKEDFYTDYGFYPSPSAITLFFAIFGDPSDNIKGAINIKKSLEMIRNSANDAIKWLGENDMSIDQLIKEFNIGVSIETIDIATETPLKFLVANIISMDLNSLVLDHILTNINLIKSRCPDYSKYAHSNPDNPTLNAILEESLDRVKKPGKKFKFGGIKVS